MAELALPAIDLIPDQGVANMAHVNPNLMRAARLQPTYNFGSMRAKRTFDRNARHRMTPALEQHGLALAIGLVARQMCCDLERASRFETDPARAPKSRIPVIGNTMAKRAIGAACCMRRELFGQPVMGGVGLGNHKQTRCVLVDPVNDAGTFFAADAGERVDEMVEKRIHERARRRTGCWVDDHTGRFVYDDQVVVFVYDDKRDVLGHSVAVLSLGDRYLEGIALADLRADIRDRCPVLSDSPVFK